MIGVRPRAECRSCGFEYSLTNDDLIHRHLFEGSGCPGSGRPPAGEEPCGFWCGRMVGRVSWPADLASADLSQGHASTYVCTDPDHHAEAAAWVRQKTGHAGVFVGRAELARA